ncbi:MAG: ArsR family transcriptional regulator [Promethearchaeota archaeon]
MSPNQESEENIDTKAILEASAAVFKEERTRWLIGKGEHLLRTGKLTEEQFNELLDKVLKDEIEREQISQVLREKGSSTIEDISKITKLSSKLILKHLIALKKLNLVNIVGESDDDYLYALI